MNVVRDLRNTITHLEAELEKKEKLIKKQQQDYEEAIFNLQAENQKLKILVQGDSITHKDDDFLKESYPLVRENTDKKQQISFVPNFDFMELVNENNFLRNEITELSSTYQKQIDQLVFYFEKIKHETKRVSPAHYIGQIKMMSSWMESCIKDLQSQKNKYEKKLMECGETLDLYEKKIVSLNNEIMNLKQELEESEEKFKIISRVRF